MINIEGIPKFKQIAMVNNYKITDLKIKWHLLTSATWWENSNFLISKNDYQRLLASWGGGGHPQEMF